MKLPQMPRMPSPLPLRTADMLFVGCHGCGADTSLLLLRRTYPLLPLTAGAGNSTLFKGIFFSICLRKKNLNLYFQNIYLLTLALQKYSYVG